MDNEILCRQIWKKVCVPNSTVNDIKTDRLLNIMVECLADMESSDVAVERYIMARVKILGNADVQALKFAWGDSISEYLNERDDAGYPIHKNIDDYDADVELAHTEVRHAITNLKLQGLLVEIGCEIRLAQ